MRTYTVKRDSGVGVISESGELTLYGAGGAPTDLVSGTPVTIPAEFASRYWLGPGIIPTSTIPVDAASQYEIYDLLIQSKDETEGSTDMTDYSTNAMTIGVAGDTSHTRLFPNLSNSAIAFDGGNDFITAPLEFNHPTSDFTIHWTAYRRATSASKAMFVTNGGVSGYSAIVGGRDNDDGTHGVYLSNGSTWTTDAASCFGDIVLNEWRHYAIVRSEGTFYFFVNGSLTQTLVSAVSLKVESSGMSIGRNLPGYDLNGLTDQFAVSSTAIWTSGFTAPRVLVPTP